MATKEQSQAEEVKAVEVNAAPAAASDNNDTFAIAALVLGVINLCSWIIPLCGCPMSIIGIVLGVMGMKSTKNKTLAMVGLVLSVIGLIASLVNAVLGAAISLNG